MYLVSVDFSKNNLLTEQLSVRSFYDLPILNYPLIELQLNNFADITIRKAFITNDENFIKKYTLFETASLGFSELYRELFSYTADETVFLFRNDVFFEFDISNTLNFACEDQIIGLKDNEDICFGIMCSLNSVKKLYNKNIDFFELMNNSGKYVDFYKNVAGYIRALNNVKSYKSLLFDILNEKTEFKPPHIAEGIFTDGNIPKGDFSITPPVYLGESIQIENGSTVGPNTVIYNNTLISSNTSVKNSILFENVYISSGCFIDGAVCCENSSVKRNSAVFAGSVIGANSLIGEDMTVENDSLINKNVKFDSFLKSPFTNKINHSYKDNFQGLSPDKAALLGASVATVFRMPKIAIGSDGEPNSLAIKLALLSGLISSGAECFDVGVTFESHVFFGSVFCECNYSVYVKGKGGGTNIEIFNSKNEPISKAECCNLFDFCNKGKFAYVKPHDCKNVRQIHGLKKMYIREITAMFEEDLEFLPTVSCKNKILLRTFEEISKKITKNTNTNHKLHINLNDSGTKVSIKYYDKVYSEKDLKKIVFFYLKNDTDINSSDGNLYRFLWKVDCVFLLAEVFNIIKKTGKNINDLISDLPNFYINSKNLKFPYKIGETAKRISDFQNFNYKNESYNIKLKKGLVKVIKNSLSDQGKIICAAENMSVSAELCDFVSQHIEDI